MYDLHEKFLKSLEEIKHQSDSRQNYSEIDGLFQEKKCGMCGENHPFGTQLCPNMRWNYNPVRVL